MANRLKIAKRIFTEQIGAEKFIFLQIHWKKLNKNYTILLLLLL